MTWLYVIALSLLSGLLYWVGGQSWGKKFIRRIFCSATALCVYWLLAGFYTAYWLAYLLTFGLQYGALTTYCTPKKQEDVKWWNWALTGLLYGLSAIFLAIVSGDWAAFVTRIVFLGITVCLLSEKLDNDFEEEVARGLLFTGSVPILLI